MWDVGCCRNRNCTENLRTARPPEGRRRRKEMVVTSEVVTTDPRKRAQSRSQLPGQTGVSGASSSRGNSRSVGRRSSASPVRRQVGARLASARDRQRLRERHAEECERVENMLASAPDPLEPPSGWVMSPDASGSRTLPTRQALAAAGCPVCGTTQIVCDEVIQLGTLRLSQCSRCDHRWTHRSGDRWAEVGATMNRPGRPNVRRVVRQGAMPL